MLAAPRRMLALHGNPRLSAAVASATINAFIPWMAKDAVAGYHAIDVLVIGSNPLLAAMAVHRASGQGLSVALALGNELDAWPYDLAASKQGASLIEGAFRLPAVCIGAPDLRRVRSLRELMSATEGAISVLDPNTSLSLANRKTSDEILVHARMGLPVRCGDLAHERMLSEFRSAASHHPVLGVPHGRRQTAIFAKSIVLVSLVREFAEAVGCDRSKSIIWQDRRILPFGSARWTPLDAPEAAERMVEDIVELARVDFTTLHLPEDKAT